MERTNTEFRDLRQNILRNMAIGIKHINSFVHQLMAKPSKGSPKQEILIIDRYLTPSIKIASTAFDRMIECANELLDTVNNWLEDNVAECKRMSDDMKSLRIKQNQLEKQLKGKQRDINQAKKNLITKEHLLSTTEDILKSNEEELKRKESARDAIIEDSKSLLNLVPVIALINVVRLIYAGTLLQDAINDQRRVVKACADEVSSSKSALKEAICEQIELKSELRALFETKKTTEKKLARTFKERTDLEAYQKSIIDFNVATKRSNHSLTKLHGQFKVLKTEAVDGYMLIVLIEPTKNFCKSLTQCAGLRHLSEGADDVSIAIKELTQRLELQ